MKKILAVSIIVFLLFVSGFWTKNVCAQDTQSGKTAMSDMLLAYYYPQTDAKSEISMRIVNRQGQVRERRLTMLRLNQTPGGDQSYYIYFHEPADVKGMSFLVLKHLGRDDDRWMYLPAIDLVKRIATSDKRTSFAGSDFTYEDVSGRALDEDAHELIGEEDLNIYHCLVVKSTPKRPDEAGFSYRKFWIDKATHLPLKVEHYNIKGKLYKVYETQDIQTLQDTPTITKATMKDLAGERYTEITMKEVSYNVGITSDIFQERLLRRPPRQWIGD
ncbi:MAG: outer membrane lipoprotein-sorting protein [Candidatus Omnitrophica bacterium CG07_land_8_20_14_0_80_42_15]|uniref:Outer membrane lipoprotein-sorting protein n=1 Tax=Candidatus Aquitaenariimonas noxiae TaxID=1974741 RepID=A0A2J0KXN4_9BACT|nr:MAG: outer membrane lipoprotein-sorting protein [Candidatus Omnitrophica bacterium CG07_land_8_20_14_0_80_42_15]